MRTTVRALGIALFICMLSTASASAGQIVYSSQGSIYVANDDGSGSRLLIGASDVPGASSVSSAFIQPNSSTVIFTAYTPYVRNDGIYCGFDCEGVYRWDNGTITRLSDPASSCPSGTSRCGVRDTNPSLSADGSRFFFNQVTSTPGSNGSANQNTFWKEGPAVARGEDQSADVQGDCSSGFDFVYAPSGLGYAYIDCDPNPPSQFGSYNGATVQPAGGQPQIIGEDTDSLPRNLAWSPDEGRIAQVESGADPGIWTYSTGKDQDADPHNPLAQAFDSDHSTINTHLAYVGNDKIAFTWGDEVRTVATSCDPCSMDQTTHVISATSPDGIGWTSQTLPVITRPGSGASNPGGGTAGGGTSQTSGGGGSTTTTGGRVTLTPFKAKLGTALKGLVVPFTATGPGTVVFKATLDAKTAKKLKLIKKGKKPVTVGSGKATAKGAGSASAKLKFTKTAVKRLKKAKTVKLKLVGEFTPASGGTVQSIGETVTLKR